MLCAGALLVPAGCGGDDGGAADPGGRVVSDPGVAHVHGVGINPADGAVVVASHTGLFRAGPGETSARRVGDRRQDTMGFTVVGPDRFLGSGHPDLRDELPPQLGLIRSDDAGRSWRPVSLLGEADFHVLRAAGRRVYGVNALDGMLLASSDGGRTWQRRTPPGPVLDLAVDPQDGRRLVAATDRGLFLSPDGGAGWRPVNADRAGLLTWTDRLVLADGAGDVFASNDRGRTFAQVGRLGRPPVALASHDGTLLAALDDATVHLSADGGRTWRLRVRSGTS
jgi:photosystem II stability/assembly factor-like uncharacterized protein